MAERQWGFTPAGSNYPPFLNVTELADGSFRVSVRSPVSADGVCGSVSAITMDGVDFLLWLRELSDGLIK